MITVELMDHDRTGAQERMDCRECGRTWLDLNLGDRLDWRPWTIVGGDIAQDRVRRRVICPWCVDELIDLLSRAQLHFDGELTHEERRAQSLEEHREQVRQAAVQGDLEAGFRPRLVKGGKE